MSDLVNPPASTTPPVTEGGAAEPTLFDLSSHVEDGKILGQFASVQELLDAAAAGTAVTPPAPQGDLDNPPAPPVTPPASTDPLQIDTTTPPAGLTQEVMGELYQQAVRNNGELTPEGYTKLEGLGISKEIAGQFIQGQMALQANARQVVEKAVGGPEVVQKALTWAKGNLPAAEQAQINADLAAASPQGQAAILQSLATRAQVVPTALGGTSNLAGVLPFKHEAEWKEAMNDPQYSKSTVYRENVEARLRAAMQAGTIR